jgi:hypothetical protein
MAKYCEVTLKYMNPQCHDNPNEKQKVYTTNFLSKCANTPKPQIKPIPIKTCNAQNNPVHR